MPIKDLEKRREYFRRYYSYNKDGYKKRRQISRKKTRTERREYIKTIKTMNYCTDCKQYYPYYVMDFDHINKDKEKTIAKLVNDGSMKKLLQEIKKCELVCSNCHRERSFKRQAGMDGIGIHTTLKT